MNIIMIGLVFSIQAFVFFSFGSLLTHFFYKKTPSFFLIMISGFLCNFSVFELIALPFTLAKQPLSRLTLVWTLLVCLAVLAAVFFCHKDWLRLLTGIFSKIKKHSWLFLLLSVCVLFQMILVFNHMDSSADASYYVGKVSTDIYTDSLGLYDPYTGNALSNFNIRYLFSCFPDYNAVIAQFFHIHALKQAKVIMPELIILITNMIYYVIGMNLFGNDRKKASLFVMFVFLINYYSNTIYTSANFLFLRTYEGKSILANIIMGVLIYGFLSLYRNDKQLFPKILLLLTGISSVTFSSSSMLMVPVALCGGCFILSILKKKWTDMGWYLLYALPNLTAAILYLLFKSGILSSKI